VQAWLLLILGASSAFATTSALFRIRRPASAGFMFMVVSWWTGEYPLFHIATQILVAAALFEGTEQPIGLLGLAFFVTSWAGLLVVRYIQREARPSGELALRAGLGTDYLDEISSERRIGLRTRPERGLTMLPMRFRRGGIEISRDIAYGDHKRNVLDVYVPYSVTDPDRRLPVVLQVHGGGWMIGNKS